jgi:hypothetical protein
MNLDRDMGLIKDSPPCQPFARRSKVRGYVWAALAMIFFACEINCRIQTGHYDFFLFVYSIFFSCGAVLQIFGRDKIQAWTAQEFLRLASLFLTIGYSIVKYQHPQITTINLATLHGHGAGTDPDEKPITISQLLDILDKSPEAKAVLEIPNYRITAERVTPFEKIVTERAGRDGGPLIHDQPAWFRREQDDV